MADARAKTGQTQSTTEERTQNDGKRGKPGRVFSIYLSQAGLELTKWHGLVSDVWQLSWLQTQRAAGLQVTIITSGSAEGSLCPPQDASRRGKCPTLSYTSILPLSFMRQISNCHTMQLQRLDRVSQARLERPFNDQIRRVRRSGRWTVYLLPDCNQSEDKWIQGVGRNTNSRVHPSPRGFVPSHFHFLSLYLATFFLKAEFGKGITVERPGRDCLSQWMRLVSMTMRWGDS